MVPRVSGPGFVRLVFMLGQFVDDFTTPVWLPERYFRVYGLGV